MGLFSEVPLSPPPAAPQWLKAWLWARCSASPLSSAPAQKGTFRLLALEPSGETRCGKGGDPDPGSALSPVLTGFPTRYPLSGYRGGVTPFRRWARGGLVIQ